MPLFFVIVPFAVKVWLEYIPILREPHINDVCYFGRQLEKVRLFFSLINIITITVIIAEINYLKRKVSLAISLSITYCSQLTRRRYQWKNRSLNEQTKRQVLARFDDCFYSRGSLAQKHRLPMKNEKKKIKPLLFLRKASLSIGFILKRCCYWQIHMQVSRIYI